jgi:hypothetical protein
MASMIKMMAATPPMTPPAIAPTGVVLTLLTAGTAVGVIEAEEDDEDDEVVNGSVVV